MTGQEYMAAVRSLPCCICSLYGEIQRTSTQAHHPICGRYSTTKVPDDMCIPLCECHHQGLWGASPEKIAIHRNKTAWVEEYGPDTDFIAATQDAIERFSK